MLCGSSENLVVRVECGAKLFDSRFIYLMEMQGLDKVGGQLAKASMHLYRHALRSKDGDFLRCFNNELDSQRKVKYKNIAKK